MIFGAGGHAASIADVIVRGGGVVIAVIGRADRDWSVPVLESDIEGIALASSQGAHIALGIGDNVIRDRLLSNESIRELARPLRAADAGIAETAQVQEGVAIMCRAHIGPGVSLGRGTLINTHAVVEHDCIIGEVTHIAPGSVLLGACVVRRSALVGAGAVVLSGREIGADAVVAAGAVVTRDVADGSTVAGVPARVTERHESPSSARST